MTNQATEERVLDAIGRRRELVNDASEVALPRAVP